MREGLNISAVEHYKMLLNLLIALPKVESTDTLRPETGHSLLVCIVKNGDYHIHRLWENKGQVTAQPDFTITHLTLSKWRERAILELGAAALDEMNLTHLNNTLCNGNIRTVESALRDTKRPSSETTEKTDGSLSQ